MSKTATTVSDSILINTQAEELCPNCKAPLLGDFCYVCGQPKKGFIRHLSGIVADFLDTVFNIDSRTLRTVLPLYFKPGFLSTEYFAGRRVRFVSPLRLYFFISVLAFLVMPLVAHFKVNTANGGIAIDLDAQPTTIQELDNQKRQALAGLEAGKPHMPALAYVTARNELEAEFAQKRQQILKTKAARELATDKDSAKISVVATKPKKSIETDSIGDPNPYKINFFSGKPWHPETNPAQFSWLGETGNHWLNVQLGRLASNLKIAKSQPEKLLAQMFAKAPQTLFMLLPVFALMLKIFFLFKRRLYMEHMIVALHSHSFLALSILFLVGLSLLNKLLPANGMMASGTSFLMVLVWCWIPLYLLLAQKRIYRQGWPITTIKYLLIGISYTVLLSFGMVFNVLFSLVTL